MSLPPRHARGVSADRPGARPVAAQCDPRVETFGDYLRAADARDVPATIEAKRRLMAAGILVAIVAPRGRRRRP